MADGARFNGWCIVLEVLRKLRAGGLRLSSGPAALEDSRFTPPSYFWATRSQSVQPKGEHAFPAMWKLGCQSSGLQDQANIPLVNEKGKIRGSALSEKPDKTPGSLDPSFTKSERDTNNAFDGDY